MKVIKASHTPTRNESTTNPQPTHTTKEDKELKKKKKEKPPKGGKKKEAEAALSSPSSPSPDFLKFQEWIKKHAPFCANEKNMKQITEKELAKLKAKYTGTEVAEVIEKIENRKDKRKNYANLYRTVLSWIKNEYGAK